MSSSGGAAGGSRRNDWRGKGGGRRPSPRSAPIGDDRWRKKADGTPADFSARRRRLLLSRVAFSGAATALVVALVWLLLGMKRQVPLIAGVVSSYRAPLAPPTLAEEDRIVLESLSRGGSALDPGTARTVDVSARLREADREQFLQAFVREIAALRGGGGPDSDAVIVYVSAHGAIDRRGRACLVPPRLSIDASADADEAWLPVGDLLDACLAARGRGMRLVVVLDACRSAQGEPLGILDGTFPAAVDAELRARPPDGLWVLLPCSVGQVATAAAPEPASTFAAAFADGLEGMADERPWGNADGRVGLRELAGYLGDEVDRRSIVHHGRPQTPVVLPTLSEGGPDVAIAWKVRGARRSRPAVTTGARDAEQLAWLQRRWAEAERLRPRGVQERPTSWGGHERLLLRAERLGVAGAGGREDFRQAKADVEALEKTLAEPLVGIDWLPGLRLARQSRDPGGPVATAWRAKLDAWVRSVAGEAAANGGDQAPGEPATGAEEWYGRASDAWAVAVQQVRAGTSPDRAAWRRWRALVETPPDEVLLPAELQPFDVLCRWADDEGWKTNAATFARVITLAEGAAEAALPDDVRADQWVAAAAPRRDADQGRRQAFDLALVGDPLALARATESARSADDRYASIALLGREVSAAWRLLDVVRAEIPWLAAWQNASRRSTPDARSASSAVEWPRLLAAAAALERSLYARAEGGESTAGVELIRGAARELVQQYEALRDAFDVACERLAQQSAEDATTLADIRAVLDTPLVAGSPRMRLLEREAALAVKVAQRPVEAAGASARPLTPDPTGAAAAWVSWNGGWIDPLVACLGRADEQGVQRPQSTADVATLAAAWGQRLRAGAAERVADRIEPPAQRRLAFLAASIAGSAGPAAEDRSPVAVQLRRAWRDRLVAFATDQMDDFFAADGNAFWAADAAAVCLRQAEILAPSDPPFERALLRREAIARLPARWARIENQPDRLGSGDGAAGSRIKTVLRLDGTLARFLPTGDATVWLADSSAAEPLWLRGAGSDVAVRRVPLPVGRADVDGGPRGVEWRVDGKSAGQVSARQNGSLDVTALFRGHRIVGGIPVVAPGGTEPIVFRSVPPAPPRITVRGGKERHGFVSFVFDCSGSMDKDTPGGRRRFDVGRQAFVEILKAMAESGNWDASVWLYGHRTRWDASTKPAQAAFSPAGLRQQAAARQAGRPFDLQPGEDVEQVLAMQPLARGQARTIGDVLNGLQPSGETPLYLAMQKALAGDATSVAAGEAWRVIVITDGVNDQYQGPFTTAAQVRETLQAVGKGRTGRVPIDAIALDLRPKPGEQAAFDELKGLVRDAGGQFRDAADLPKLMESLREFLQLARWELVDGRGSARQAELGAAVTVDPPPAAEPPLGYTLQLEGRPQTATKVAVAGGESLELFVSADGTRLEHRRYDGGTEQGIRARHEDLPDPADPQQRWFVAAHLPKREGSAAVRFPVSIQNADETRFSPRPVDIWAEVRPEGIAGVQPFVFVDAAFEQNRPVPVIDLTVPNWPKDAGWAQIGLWFCTRPLEPAGVIAADELRFMEAKEFRWPRLAGVTIEASLEKAGTERARLTVVERHAAGAEGGLPRLRVRLEPACERAEHVVDPSAGSVRHAFDIALDQGRVPKGTRLTVVDHDRLKEQAVGPAVVGGRVEFLRVPLPRD
jgi:hypothetical protein